VADVEPYSVRRWRVFVGCGVSGDLFDLQCERPFPARRPLLPTHVHGVLGVVVVIDRDLHSKVCKVWRVEVDDAGFDVMAGVDEGQKVGFTTGRSVGVAGIEYVKDVGNCREGLVFVGAADIIVGCDFPDGLLVSSP